VYENRIQKYDSEIYEEYFIHDTLFPVPQSHADYGRAIIHK